MKAVEPVAAFTAAAMIVCWDGAAQAYQPFDGTDATVAETGEIEIELGPVEYICEAPERELFAPDLRINYGFAPDWEASLEGDVAHGLTGGFPGTSLIEAEALLKRVWREGSLQEKPGPVSRPNSASYCRGSMTNMGLERSSPASPPNAGTGERSTSMLKLSLPESGTLITFSTPSSRVRMTGPCGRSPKPFMRAMLACSNRVRPRGSNRAGPGQSSGRLRDTRRAC